MIYTTGISIYVLYQGRYKQKLSFTTAEVQELGQALGISQLHRSLEKISTFL